MTNKLSILILLFIFGCHTKSKHESEQARVSGIEKMQITDALPKKLIQYNYPKRPEIGKGYKFLTKVDSINYIIIVERIDSTRIEYRFDQDNDELHMRHGTAELVFGSPLIERSVLTEREFSAVEFQEKKNECIIRIRIGLDSIGSGDRLLLNYYSNCANSNGEILRFAN